MALSEEIPQWALDRVEQEAGPRPRPECIPEDETIIIAKAFARYIAQHEQPPVDPDVLEARQLIADVYGCTRNDDGKITIGDGPPRVEAIKTGRGDDYWEMRVVLAALKSRKHKEAGK